MKRQYSQLVKLTWLDIREQVSSVNARLADIIDRISPSKEFGLYLASYRYGSPILIKGNFFVPDSTDSSISLKDATVPDKVKEDLSYNNYSHPASIIIDGAAELFVDRNNRIVPYFMMQTGNMYGVWPILDKRYKDKLTFAPTNIWDMTAGARTIFSLPKITDVASHMKLQRKYSFEAEPPNSYYDHWNVFKSISQSSYFETPWRTQILYFSKEWFQHLTDKAWQEFYIYLLSTNWACCEFQRNQFTWDFVFKEIEKIRGVNPSPYHADICKHLYSIAVGAMPGLAPAIDDKLAPVSTLKKIYAEEYGLKQWSPVIMQPANYQSNTSNPEPVYYSFQCPTAVSLSSRSSKKASTLTDAYIVSTLIKKYSKEIIDRSINLANTTLEDAAINSAFEFFHSRNDDYSDFKSVNDIPNADHRFQDSPSHLSFPVNASFLKGCVKIHTKDENSQ